MNQHTPGPWKFKRARRTSTVVEVIGAAKQRPIVCFVNIEQMGVHVGCGTETPAANVRLITAAPELLAALEACEAMLNGKTHHDGELIDGFVVLARAESAIAKAKGGN